MKHGAFVSALIFFLAAASPAPANQHETLPAFQWEPNPLTLTRPARPGFPFHKSGRRFAILGDETGTFEAWAYPLKLLRDFKFSFLTGGSTQPIPARDLIHEISVKPEVTTLVFIHQEFTVNVSYLSSLENAGAVILIAVDSIVPLTLVCGFRPVLQPMWPAGIGGQRARWDPGLKAYILSEPTGRNHGIVGSPAAEGISASPAHMLADSPSEFKIEISDPVKFRNRFISIAIAGGNGKPESVRETYRVLLHDPEALYRKNLLHFRALREKTLQLQTPDTSLNQAFEWAKVTFDNLMVDNPDLGLGMIAGLGASGTSGRPGFGWFFSGDTYINTLSLVGCGAYELARKALAFTQKWQREDGKMAHELSQSAAYIDWWNDYPYGYIHGDTTPYYITAMWEYARATGDTDFIRKSWDSLQRAFAWCLSTDANRDGLMDNRSAGLGALEYGDLTGIETDIYLAAVWVNAVRSMTRLAALLGEKTDEKQASGLFDRALDAFQNRFWNPDLEFYAYAFDEPGRHIEEISPWCAPGLMWDLGEPEKSRLSLEKIISSALNTDWGIRSLSRESSLYRPLDYNYGAVWPFISGWVNAALFEHGMSQQGWDLLHATAHHTFEHGLGTITEVFSGDTNMWAAEAVSQQGFSSAGLVLPLVRGLCGLRTNAHRRSGIFAPQFPPDWENVRIRNFKLGEGSADIDYRRSERSVILSVQGKDIEGTTLSLAPGLAPGTTMESVTVNGEEIEFSIEKSPQLIRPRLDIRPKNEATEVVFAFRPTLEVLSIPPSFRVGCRSSGLKVIRLRNDGRELRLLVEGLTGRMYSVPLHNVFLAESAFGGKLKSSRLDITIPQGRSGEFCRHEVVIRLKK